MKERRPAAEKVRTACTAVAELACSSHYCLHRTPGLGCWLTGKGHRQAGGTQGRLPLHGMTALCPLLVMACRQRGSRGG